MGVASSHASGGHGDSHEKDSLSSLRQRIREWTVTDVSRAWDRASVLVPHMQRRKDVDVLGASVPKRGFYELFARAREGFVMSSAAPGEPVGLPLSSFSTFRDKASGRVPLSRVFLPLALLCVGSQSAKLTLCFSMVDRDGNGEMDEEELESFLRDAANAMVGIGAVSKESAEFDDETLRRMTVSIFEEADEDGSGSVDAEEFVSWMRTHMKGSAFTAAVDAATEAARLEQQIREEEEKAARRMRGAGGTKGGAGVMSPPPMATRTASAGMVPRRLTRPKTMRPPHLSRTHSLPHEQDFDGFGWADGLADEEDDKRPPGWTLKPMQEMLRILNMAQRRSTSHRAKARLWRKKAKTVVMEIKERRAQEEADKEAQRIREKIKRGESFREFNAEEEGDGGIGIDGDGVDGEGGGALSKPHPLFPSSSTSTTSLPASKSSSASLFQALATSPPPMANVASIPDLKRDWKKLDLDALAKVEEEEEKKEEVERRRRRRSKRGVRRGNGRRRVVGGGGRGGGGGEEGGGEGGRKIELFRDPSWVGVELDVESGRGGKTKERMLGSASAPQFSPVRPLSSSRSSAALMLSTHLKIPTTHDTYGREFFEDSSRSRKRSSTSATPSTPLTPFTSSPHHGDRRLARGLRGTSVHKLRVPSSNSQPPIRQSQIASTASLTLPKPTPPKQQSTARVSPPIKVPDAFFPTQ